MMRKLTAIVVMLVLACSSKKPAAEEETPATPTAPVAETPPPPTGSAPPRVEPAAVAPALPKECDDYKAMAERLATCEKLGATRDILAGEFARSWKAWSDLPADQRGDVASKCTTAATALKSAVAATCGW